MRQHFALDWQGIAVLTCWDADRPDLGRVGIKQNPEKLFTSAASQKSMIDWAHKRAACWRSEYYGYNGRIADE